MKKILFLHPLLFLVIVLSFSLFSCTKQKPELPLSTGNATANISSERVGNWGSVTGMILPLRAINIVSNVSIKIYNRYFSSTDFYYTRDGSFKFDRIPQGVYAVIIVDLATSIEYTIPFVRVRAGNLTNLGVIKLH
jgi:hypothetical protein